MSRIFKTKERILTHRLYRVKCSICGNSGESSEGWWYPSCTHFPEHYEKSIYETYENVDKYIEEE